MRGVHQYLLLMLLTSCCCSADRVTSIVTVIATSSTRTPCSELDPITDRMQWAQQCVMAPSNVAPSAHSPAASTTCSGAGCSSHRTTPVRTSRASSRPTESSRTSSRKTSPQSSPSQSDTKTRSTLKSTTRNPQAHSSRKPPTASTTHTTPSSSAAPSDNAQSSGPNIGAIAGLVIGVILALLLGWFLWRTKDRWSGYLPGSHYDYSDSDEGYWRDGGRFESCYSYQDPPPRRKFSCDRSDFEDSPTAPYDVRNIGAGMRGVTNYGYGRSYAVMNPDPPSASTVAPQTREEDIRGYQRRKVEHGEDENEEDSEDQDDDMDEDNSQESDSDTSSSRRDPAQSSAQASSFYSEDDDEHQPRTIESEILELYDCQESYDRRGKIRRPNSAALFYMPSSATYSGPETDSDWQPSTTSPIEIPRAAYTAYTRGAEFASLRPSSEFKGARTYWKFEGPWRSKLGGSPLE